MILAPVTHLLFLFFAFSTILQAMDSIEDSIEQPKQLQLSITSEQYDTFQKLRVKYYNNSLSEITPPEKFPLFRFTHKKHNYELFVLGTRHDLPFESLPNWFSNFIKNKVEEVCIECDFLNAFLNSKKQQTYDSLDTKTSEAVSSFLDAFLKIFSKTTSDLSIQETYALVMGYDAVIGMDATIEALSLNLGKPVVLLDKQINIAEKSLELHKLSIERYIEFLEDHLLTLSTEEEILNTQERLKKQQNFLKMTDEKLMISYIKAIVPHLQEGQKVTNSDLESWSEMASLCLESGYLETLMKEKQYKDMQTDERNKFWTDYLNLNPKSGRLVCGGVAHLPGIFKNLNESGWELDQSFDKNLTANDNKGAFLQ